MRPESKTNSGLGCHHWPISPVNVAKVRSGGAGTRSATNTRDPADPVTRCARCVAGHVFGEGAELLGPAALGVGQPSAELLHGRGAERIDAHPGVDVGMGVGDQSPGPQHPQMLAHGGRAHPDQRREFPRTPRPLGEHFDGSAPRRVGQCGEGGIETGCRFAHCQFVAVIDAPIAFSASARLTALTGWENTQKCPSRSTAR